MQNLRWIQITLLIALIAASGTQAREKDRTLRLVFIPQEVTGSSDPGPVTGPLSQPLAVAFEDGRALTDPAVIGQGTGDDDEVFTWFSDGDSGAFAREVFARTASEWGLTIVPESDLVLTVRLVRFSVTEHDQAVGSSYTAEARLLGSLRRGEGDQLGQAVGIGDARRYGRKRSAVNCNEVLSDALKEAYASLLGNPALAKGAAEAQPQEVAAGSPIKPDDLLLELTRLVAKGFEEELLVEYVSQKRLTRPLEADDLLKWKDAKIPEAVIRTAMGQAPRTE